MGKQFNNSLETRSNPLEDISCKKIIMMVKTRVVFTVGSIKMMLLTCLYLSQSLSPFFGSGGMGKPQMREEEIIINQINK